MENIFYHEWITFETIYTLFFLIMKDEIKSSKITNIYTEKLYDLFQFRNLKLTNYRRKDKCHLYV